MTGKRKRHTAQFKAKVALEAAKEVKTLNELGSQYNLHPTQISQWKTSFVEGMSEIFRFIRLNNAFACVNDIGAT